MMRGRLVVATLASIIIATVTLGATEEPKPHWSLKAAKEKPQVTITVTTAELAKEQSLVKATCEIAFFDRSGKKLRSELFDVDVPISASSKKTQEFSYDPPPAVTTKGIKMDYRIATRRFATDQFPASLIEETFSDGSVAPDQGEPQRGAPNSAAPADPKAPLSGR